MDIPSVLVLLGACAFTPAILFLLAGAGWRKLASGLAIGLAITLVVTVAGTAAGIAIGNVTETGGGEFRGLGVLFIGVCVGICSMFVSLVGATWWLVRSGRITRERATRSKSLLTIGSICLTFAFGSFIYVAILSTPSLASNEQLAQQVGYNESEARKEIIKRGPAAVPAIIAELHRHPYKKTREDESIELSSIVPLLGILGQIGGPDALAEITRWTAADVPSYIRVAAMEVLAEKGDSSVLPVVVKMLEDNSDADWEFRRSDLFKALGALKAAQHVGLIRTALIGEPARKHGYIAFETILAGVSALVAINTDQAWAVIGELIAANDKGIRQDAVNAIARFPGPRTISALTKALDDPEKENQQSAYAALLRADPTLLESEPNTAWSEENVKRLRAALKARGGSKP